MVGVQVRVPLCDHVANLGYIDRLLLEENLTTSHGRKAMLKYLIILVRRRRQPRCDTRHDA